MIVPQRRLIWWSAAVLLPAGVCLAVAPALAAGAFVIYAIIAIVDALFVIRPLAGITIELPGVTRLTRLRPGKLPIRVHNRTLGTITVRIGFAFPAGLRSESPVLWVEVPASASGNCEWPLTGGNRGRYTLHDCHVETGSRLGLWNVQGRKPCDGEIRVYPDLLRERKKAASLLVRGITGAHRLRQLGQGREFEKLRDYMPGDSYSEIHWKATAKRSRPITKLYQVEKTQQIYVILDVSRLAGRVLDEEARPLPIDEGAKRLANGTSDPPSQRAIEYYLTATLLLAAAAHKQGDLFGAVAFSDRIDRFVRAGAGRSSFQACRQALYDLQAKTVSPDLEELASFIGTRLRRRALLVFLTDLDDPVAAEGFVRNMEIIGSRHLVLVNSLRHAWTGRLFSGSEVKTTEDVYRVLAGHMEWQKGVEIQRSLQRIGVRYEQLTAARFASELIAQYFNVKQRQLL